jgi:hypothetical protein
MLGKPRAFIHFILVIVALGALLAIRWNGMDAAMSWLLLAVLVVGAIVALWQVWSGRAYARANTFPSQLGAMPKKWQKWVLGESDDQRQG